MKFKSFCLLALCMLSVDTAQARMYSLKEYNFPIKDSYWATIAAALNGTDFKFSTFRLEVRPERKNIPLIEDRHRIPINIFIHDNSQAPLIFIIAGLGGSAFSGTALYLAEQIYQQGYHVMTLPNPMSWQYTLGVSANGAPGYLPQDTLEYYELLALATDYAKRKYNIYPSRYSILGYSLGGLLAAFLTELDTKNEYFSFEKTILINPAIDVKFGAEIFDTYYSLGQSWSMDTKFALNGLLLEASLYLMETNQITDQRISTQIESQHTLSEKQKKWLISDFFRSDLRDIIFVSQQIKDQEILKIQASKYLKNARFEEAKQVTYWEYINKIVIPRNHLETEGTVDELMNKSSLYKVLKTISHKKSVFVQVSQDDFLLKTGDIEFLRTQLKDRLYLYPYGGHVGNVRFETNQNDLRDILSSK